MKRLIALAVLLLTFGCADPQDRIAKRTEKDQKDQPAYKDAATKDDPSKYVPLDAVPSKDAPFKSPPRKDAPFKDKTERNPPLHKDKLPTKGLNGEIDSDKTESAPIPKASWNLDYLEKTWGLKLKSFLYVETIFPNVEVAIPDVKYKLLLEFTKDLTEPEWESLAKAVGLKSRGTWDGMALAFSDKDNVVIGVYDGQGGHSIVGWVTGKKGDAFWLVIGARPHVIREGAVKAEMRPAKKP